jgi:DNA-binding transcriptional regulator GbsR (MarR family)
MPKVKLSEEDIAGIRYARREGMTLGDLSEVYGVSRTQIWRIVHKLQRKTPLLKAKPSLRSA